MKIYIEPARDLWNEIARRPEKNEKMVQETVNSILEDVKKRGNEALFFYTKVLDGAKLNSFGVNIKTIKESGRFLDEKLKEAISLAASNIEKFHKAQIVPDVDVITSPGVRCIQRRLPLTRVGLYVPGGSAPLFSTVLMLGIPAKVAGCKEIVLFTPPNKLGEINPAILFAADYLGIKEIYTIGGAQAIGAMAYGTESINKVDKIFGPGNSFVAFAKQAICKDVAVDMFAGPSELMVIADETASPVFVAADLLSQAEHGTDSQVFLVASCPTVAEKCINEIEKQSAKLNRQKEIAGTLEKSISIILKKRENMIEFANIYAPEHLIISTVDPWGIANKIEAAGSIFIGNYSPESAGDYASGSNHTLPTGGWAKSQGGLSLDSFTHTISYQEITREGIGNLSQAIEIMASAEGLEAHRNAVTVRMEEQKNGY
ncbi:MAG: histidinol dehydrogenase [Bacteroidales bacterium]|nr:histidinol dehydrogenase [Bacteroidales bacterium]